MVLSLQEDSLKLLVQIGFTDTQAKVYLALCGIGQTDAKNLAKLADIPRQASYRTLGELQEKGIVEKIISIPQEYRAIPIKDGLSVMISAKATEYSQISEKAKQFLLRYEAQAQNRESEREYSISIMEGKDTIINRIQALTAASEKEICVCQTLQRWMHVNTAIPEIIHEALERGVKYRIVLEHSEGELFIPRGLKAVLKYPNYQLQIVKDKLKINAAIYDDKYGCFSFYPAKAIADTPVIVTNHPSLLVGFRDHFENLWRLSEKVELKNLIK